MGLKLYAQLDLASVRKLVAAAHRAGMPVWGHAWVQPASALEQASVGQDGVVHAAGFAGELFTKEERDTLVDDGNLQIATADVATVGSVHDPRILTALDSMARLGTFDAKRRHIPSEQEEYVRAASGFGMEVTREAVRRGVKISAGSDHVAYGPANERASLFGELRLLVDSIALSPHAALLAATRDAARAIGGEPARRLGTIEPGRYADLVLLSRNPLADIDNLDSVEWIMKAGQIWRPGQLRSGIAMQ
jgi:imidazolonepropionase-like amidohydrolase